MPSFRPTSILSRFVAPIPGVPDAQTRDLDRRRRLNRQLLAFRSPARSAMEIHPSAPPDPDGPGLA